MLSPPFAFSLCLYIYYFHSSSQHNGREQWKMVSNNNNHRHLLQYPVQKVVLFCYIMNIIKSVQFPSHITCDYRNIGIDKYGEGEWKYGEK